MAREREREALREREREALREREREVERVASAHLAEKGEAGGTPLPNPKPQTPNPKPQILSPKP